MSRVSWLLLVCALSAFGQTRFDVSSVRPSRPDATVRDARHMIRGDRLDFVAETVGDMLDGLNGWRLERVVGGPAWLRTDRYDIHAKADAVIPESEMKAAVLTLLAERFQLKVHTETREIPAMVLLAPKRPAGLKPGTAREGNPIHFNERSDPTFTRVSMSAVTNYLSQMWHTPVEDQTGLEGTFDFTLQPSAVQALPGGNWGDRVREAVLAFGFKVETRKVPTEITVVDRCERPGEN